jgi:hypothetical protein
MVAQLYFSINKKKEGKGEKKEGVGLGDAICGIWERNGSLVISLWKVDEFLK